MIDRYTLPKMREIWSEENKFRKWLEVELAACEAWGSLGRIPREALARIKRKASFSVERINQIEKETAHDLIAFLTSVAETVGPESRFIHLGMTSYDVEDTARSMQMRDAADLIIKDIEEVIKIVKRRAKEEKDTIMMGRTHGVHAEPITFGLKLLVWVAEMERNLVRMRNARETISVGKISGAVGTYANLDPRVEEYVCRKLKLKPSPASTQVLQRDRHAEYLTTLAVVAASLEQFATEIRNLQRTEIWEVEEPFGKGQKGSSAMPHKKNPITCERIAGLARVVRGNAMAALENVALWHERDITHSSVERVILPDSCLLVDYMLQQFARVMGGLVIMRQNMRKNIDRSAGLTFSQKLLLALTDKGLTREEAYKIVQTAAMKARASGRNLKDEILQSREAVKNLKREEIEQIFDVRSHLKNINVVFRRFGL
ncbi:adenylosuccinate lyase [candidate division WOR-1 bacterium RIFCSPHIGHO2_01_FULL_53_15]|uniref:Adenylosuccinate lyase n=1 Tax=candidate division WOR-1 bacterium RIFCSPHIGHO2_01_FULL_53_15 TaxID=1802564 RepID=A0A1F4PZT7_UNCSA|nr:MAG: adenylosuccinate lyase [candidate division WOR-1 bacterium RIFCSPHIGHO2_01_FULL_53_15]OGC10782.1 MAG: adenylosuccinate lyase [candidate division WOR-1 bacterium RIFCSPHIGHO2_02_FULL_53_26]